VPRQLHRVRTRSGKRVNELEEKFRRDMAELYQNLTESTSAEVRGARENWSTISTSQKLRTLEMEWGMRQDQKRERRAALLDGSAENPSAKELAWVSKELSRPAKSLEALLSDFENGTDKETRRAAKRRARWAAILEAEDAANPPEAVPLQGDSPSDFEAGLDSATERGAAAVPRPEKKNIAFYDDDDDE